MNLKEIFDDAQYCRVSKKANVITISVGAMYDSPMITFAKLQKLSQIFETDKITTDRFDKQGCETCDFGSDYGYDIYITDPNDTDISNMSFGEN